jgi:hypothetical protein
MGNQNEDADRIAKRPVMQSGRGVGRIEPAEHGERSAGIAQPVSRYVMGCPCGH